jgi:hypothetical protein
MKKLTNSSLFVLAVMLLTACYAKAQPGKETRNVSDFSEVGFGIAGNLYIKLGSSFSVVLEGDKDYLEIIETVVKNGKLIIRTEDHNFFSFNNHHADVYITMPSLKGLGVSGSGKATVEDPLKGESISLNVSGSGKIVVNDLKATELNSGISGSGDIVLNGSGEVQKGDFSVSGSGSFKDDNVRIANLEVRISGSGNCSCNVSDNLKASVSGSGNVWYSGNPRLDVRTSGSGHVRSK